MTLIEKLQDAKQPNLRARIRVIIARKAEIKMTRTINIGDVKNSLQTLIALTRNGDEIVLEENGKPLAKIVPFAGDDLEREFSD